MMLFSFIYSIVGATSSLSMNMNILLPMEAQIIKLYCIINLYLNSIFEFTVNLDICYLVIPNNFSLISWVPSGAWGRNDVSPPSGLVLRQSLCLPQCQYEFFPFHLDSLSPRCFRSAMLSLSRWCPYQGNLGYPVLWHS